MDATSGADRAGQVVADRYRILSLLGEGGMGAVYVAEHVLMRKRFALKLLHPEFAGNEEVLARFRREAEAAAQLDHPHVVAATDFGRLDDGSFFLVLEYVDGTSLRAALRSGPFAPERALRIGRQIALALERAHAAGIIHRDLKPENVMLVRKEDDPDFVKVLDFGIARIEPQGERAGAQALTRVGTVIGTPEYMAPEQAIGERVTSSADLYSLGIVLYEMLTGKLPFEGDTVAMLSLHIVAPVPMMADRAPEVTVPPAIEGLVRRLLEKVPEARHPSARAVVDAIVEVAAASDVELPYERTSERLSGEGVRSSERIRIAAPQGEEASHAPSAMLAPTALGLPAVGRTTPNASFSDTLRRKAVALANEPRVKAFLTTLSAQLEPVIRRLQTTTKLSRQAIIVMMATVPLLALCVVISVLSLVFRSGSPSATSPATSSSDGAVVDAPALGPTPEELREAGKGPAELGALLEKYPDDAVVLRELVFAYDALGRSREALVVVRRLVADAGAEPIPRDIVGVVMRAASKFETSDRAFELLEEDLGTAGIDGLIVLSESTDEPERTRGRASAALLKPRVRARATPAAAFIISLQEATTCDARRDLLVRAGKNADSRALPALRALKKTNGCGRGNRYDCHRCLRGDDVLDRALTSAEDRDDH